MSSAPYKLLWVVATVAVSSQVVHRMWSCVGKTLTSAKTFPNRTCRAWKRSQWTATEKAQTKRVRTASMAARAAPLSSFVIVTCGSLGQRQGGSLDGIAVHVGWRRRC